MEHQAIAFTRMRTISRHLCDGDGASLLCGHLMVGVI